MEWRVCTEPVFFFISKTSRVDDPNPLPVFAHRPEEPGTRFPPEIPVYFEMVRDENLYSIKK